MTNKTKYFILAGILILGLVIYILNATKSGLWLDEAVEYFYSKFLTGPVPGGQGTVTMLERIRITFQPPLYNALMYLWLSVFDSEFTFRLAGILVTMAGTVGCFFAIDEALKKSVWSILGTLFYLFTYGVVYYGLECAEYNLMLCFLTWLTYFFIRVLKRKDLKSMIGFFLFSCLSIYSQYGSAFVILGMYLALAASLLAEKNYKGFRKYLLMSVIAVVAAGVPLVVFFLAYQMGRQGSVSISHMPFFANGFLYEFFIGAKNTLDSLFGNITAFGILAFAVICIIAFFIRPKKMGYPLLAFVITWLLYFFAVCCSFYGYNSWNETSIGSMNLGGRYALFLIPEIVVILVIGIGVFADWIGEKSKTVYKIVLVVFAAALIAFSGIGIWKVQVRGWNKDNVREAVAVWYDRELYHSKTLLHIYDDASFHYYMIHDDRYDPSMDAAVEGADMWIQTAGYEEMKEKLGEMGYLTEKEFYYMATDQGSYEAFLAVVRDAGYEIETVCSGKSMLLHVVKGEG